MITEQKIIVLKKIIDNAFKHIIGTKDSRIRQ